MIARLTTHSAIPLDVVLIVLAIVILYRQYKQAHQKILETQKVETISSSLNTNVIRIVTPEPPNRLPIIFDVSILIICAFTFVIGGFQLGVWVFYEASFRPLGLFLFVVSYLIAPIVVSIDFLVIQRKHRREGRSEVYAETFIQYKASNVEAVFTKCNELLDIMKAKPPTQYDKNSESHQIRRMIKSSYFTIVITPIEGKLFEIHASSDSSRVEIRWDFGRNKKNINTFKTLLLSKNLK